jgi:signal transduction histidine kinase
LTQQNQVAVASRAFCLAAIFALALLSGDADVIQGVVTVTAVAALSTYVSLILASTSIWAITIETLVVGLVMGLTYPSSVVLLPYLVALPLLAGLSRRFAGVALTMTAQVASIVVVPLAAAGFPGAGQRTEAIAPWLITNLGAGLLGVWARKLGPAAAPWKQDTNYEAARQLLTQLRTVTRRLSAGLDSDSMSAQLLASVHERLHDSYAAVFVNLNGSTLVPLGYRGLGAQQLLIPADPLIEQCWAEMEPLQTVVPSGSREARHRTALPLRVGNRMIGVVLTSAALPASPEAIAELMPDIDAQSLRLDTAMVFDEIRTMATSDERQRLAREIHDGIAQEIASLGYLVDSMSAGTQDPKMAQALQRLRSELSRVVADLRLSIFDLRSDVSPTSGLGAALSDYVRQVGAKSHLTVHLTLREAPTRLPPAVESELFRIAQEAITNARKHASARNLWVDYWAEPPEAGLLIRDDGTGLRDGRDDSYGMAIMRERASRIDASLDISSGSDAASGPGTVVQVTVAPKTVLATESRTA